jgi:hypothetical protein
MNSPCSFTRSPWGPHRLADYTADGSIHPAGSVHPIRASTCGHVDNARALPTCPQAHHQRKLMGSQATKTGHVDELATPFTIIWPVNFGPCTVLAIGLWLLARNKPRCRRRIGLAAP